MRLGGVPVVSESLASREQSRLLPVAGPTQGCLSVSEFASCDYVLIVRLLRRPQNS